MTKKKMWFIILKRKRKRDKLFKFYSKGLSHIGGRGIKLNLSDEMKNKIYKAIFNKNESDIHEYELLFVGNCNFNNISNLCEKNNLVILNKKSGIFFQPETNNIFFDCETRYLWDKLIRRIIYWSIIDENNFNFFHRLA